MIVHPFLQLLCAAQVALPTETAWIASFLPSRRKNYSCAFITFLAVSPLGYVFILENLCTLQQTFRACSVMSWAEAIQVLLLEKQRSLQGKPISRWACNKEYDMVHTTLNLMSLTGWVMTFQLPDFTLFLQKKWMSSCTFWWYNYVRRKGDIFTVYIFPKTHTA